MKKTRADYRRELVQAAEALRAELRAHGVRTEVDATSNKINGKVLKAEEARVHTMLVLGRRDLEAGVLSVRVHGRGNLGAKPRAEVVSDMLTAIRERRANEPAPH
jgi:threonyl-tRNA synthetase